MFRKNLCKIFYGNPVVYLSDLDVIFFFSLLRTRLMKIDACRWKFFFSAETEILVFYFHLNFLLEEFGINLALRFLSRQKCIKVTYTFKDIKL